MEGHKKTEKNKEGRGGPRREKEWAAERRKNSISLGNGRYMSKYLNKGSRKGD